MSNADKNTTHAQQPGEASPDQPRTEADKAAGHTGTKDKTSGDETSRTKAGTDHGAGGGAKQQQQH